ncbi:MAG: hypothetical protein ACRC8S_05205 [Fimbriiglobus sp.]
MDPLVLKILIYVSVAVIGLVIASYYRKSVQKAEAHDRLENFEWEQKHPRSAFEYCGKTLEFYNDSHGRQVEYLHPNGKCYLWYPTNTEVIIGRWKVDDISIYFKYGTDTYNPVTGVVGGGWERAYLVYWSDNITQVFEGDPLDLMSLKIPKSG